MPNSLECHIGDRVVVCESVPTDVPSTFDDPTGVITELCEGNDIVVKFDVDGIERRVSACTTAAE